MSSKIDDSLGGRPEIGKIYQCMLQNSVDHPELRIGDMFTMGGRQLSAWAHSRDIFKVTDTNLSPLKDYNIVFVYLGHLDDFPKVDVVE